MATNHDVFDAIAPTQGTPANSYELGLRVRPAGGGSHVLIPDILNLNPSLTPQVRQRGTYAYKGSANGTKYGESFSATVSIEIIRDAAGQWQPALTDLFNASKAYGEANKRSIQVLDLLGGPYAVQTLAAVSFAFDGIDFDSAKWANITFTGDGRPLWFDTNPLIVGIKATVSKATPAAATAASTLVLIGDGFTGATAVTIGGTAATALKVADDDTITVTVPAGAAGSAPIVVTTPNGVSDPFPYVRGA
jgi:hypothetical protein